MELLVLSIHMRRSLAAFTEGGGTISSSKVLRGTILSKVLRGTILSKVLGCRVAAGSWGRALGGFEALYEVVLSTFAGPAFTNKGVSARVKEVHHCTRPTIEFNVI